MSYAGDIRLSDTLDVKFTTTAFGVPTTLAGSPVVSAYPANSTTQLTAGITLSVDFDGVTGLNNVNVVASGANGYLTATNYELIITTGTVSGSSVVGYEIGSFSIENRSALMPTTAARTLEVDASGQVTVGTLAAAAIASVWAYVVEGSYTAVQFLRGIAASTIAKLSGAATTTVTIRDVADTKDRIVATVDADGNRTAEVLDLT